MVAQHVTEVADRLTARSGELVEAMDDAIEEAVEHLGDTELRNMLHASVEGNVATILQMLRNEIPLEHVTAPVAASEYAVRLARADVPGAALRRAYHIGTDSLLGHFFDEIQRLPADGDVKLRVLHDVSGWVHRYVDSVTREVLELHEAERVAMLMQSATHVSQLVQRVVEREPVDHEHFARSTGYRLDQDHVAAVVWTDSEGRGADRIEALRPLAAGLAAALGASSRPLFTPVDRSTAWVWCALGDAARRTVDVPHLLHTVRPEPALRIALGSVEAQVSGFRRSLEQATAVRMVAAAGTRQQQVMAYDEDGVATVATLARDMPATRRWVSEVLGPLANDGEAAERTRETVRVFLRTRSYTETSEELVLHRNTVKYRITKLEKERGRPLSDGRLDLELALHVCHVLGATVLHP